MDLADAHHENLAKRTTVQLQSVPDLPFDWSRFVTENGRQLQTVGHHFPLSAPLSQEVRERMSRVGVCVACHQDLPDGSLFIRAVTLGSRLFSPVDTDEDHQWVLSHILHTAATLEILVPIGVGALVLSGLFFWLRRRRRAVSADKSPGQSSGE